MRLLGAIAEATRQDGQVVRTEFKNVYEIVSVYPEGVDVDYKCQYIHIPSMQKVLAEHSFAMWLSMSSMLKGAIIIDSEDKGITEEMIEKAAEAYRRKYQPNVKTAEVIDDPANPSPAWGGKRLMALFKTLNPNTVTHSQFIILPMRDKARVLNEWIRKNGIKPEMYAEALSQV